MAQFVATRGGGVKDRQLVLAGTMILAVVLLGLAVGAGLGAEFDRAVVSALALRRGEAPDWLIAATQWFSWIGGGNQRTLSVVAIALALWRWQGALAGLAMALASLFSNLLSTLLKVEFARPRPGLTPHLDDVGAALSFPSGHSTSAAVVYLLLAWLLPAELRRPWLVLAVVLIFLTGLSRILLGVHYPSDVIGGWMLGTAFALVGVHFAGPARSSADRIRS